MKVVRTYSLQWLDSLISVTLNPGKPYRYMLTDVELSDLLEKVPLEALQVQHEFAGHVFACNKEKEVRHLVQKYYNALVSLRDLLTTYRKNTEVSVAVTTLQGQLLESVSDLIDFIAKRYEIYLYPASHSEGEGESNESKHKVLHKDIVAKVLCTLSGDQIALILRAADEAKILKARSMNLVFKLIIPHLSTPYKAELSAGAIRSKAYNPEEADRNAAIEALHRIISKIQSY